MYTEMLAITEPSVECRGHENIDSVSHAVNLLNSGLFISTYTIIAIGVTLTQILHMHAVPELAAVLVLGMHRFLLSDDIFP